MILLTARVSIRRVPLMKESNHDRGLNHRSLADGKGTSGPRQVAMVTDGRLGCCSRVHQLIRRREEEGGWR